MQSWGNRQSNKVQEGGGAGKSNILKFQGQVQGFLSSSSPHPSHIIRTEMDLDMACFCASLQPAAVSQPQDPLPPMQRPPVNLFSPPQQTSRPPYSSSSTSPMRHASSKSHDSTFYLEHNQKSPSAYNGVIPKHAGYIAYNSPNNHHSAVFDDLDKRVSKSRSHFQNDSLLQPLEINASSHGFGHGYENTFSSSNGNNNDNYSVPRTSIKEREIDNSPVKGAIEDLYANTKREPSLRSDTAIKSKTEIVLTSTKSNSTTKTWTERRGGPSESEDSALPDSSSMSPTSSSHSSGGGEVLHGDNPRYSTVNTAYVMTNPAVHARRTEAAAANPKTNESQSCNSRGPTRFLQVGHGRWANVPVNEIQQGTVGRVAQRHQVARTHSADHSSRSVNSKASVASLSPMLSARNPPIPHPVRTGWQEIKNENQSKSSDELWWSRRSNGIGEQTDSDERPTPPRPVNDLIKQFAQLDAGIASTPTTPQNRAAGGEESNKRLPKPLFHLSHQSSHESLPPYSSESAASEADSNEMETANFKQRNISSWAKSIVHTDSSSSPKYSSESNSIHDLDQSLKKSSISSQVTVITTSKQTSSNVTTIEPSKYGVKTSSRSSEQDEPKEEFIPVTNDGAYKGLCRPKDEARLLSPNVKEAALSRNVSPASPTAGSSSGQEKPSSQQLKALRELLADDFPNYRIFAVALKRSSGIEDGSVGLILTSTAASGNKGSHVTIQRVISGSIADHDNRLCKGDRIFFIQGQSTQNMAAPDARTVLKSPAAVVNLVVGRVTYAPSNGSPIPPTLKSLSTDDTFTTDPALEHYSKHPIMVTLMKTDIGIGFSIDGGRDSKYGDRPIVVKKIFSVGEAAKNGQIAIGDEVRSVDGVNLSQMTHLAAWKTLKARPEGPIQVVLYKRIVD